MQRLLDVAHVSDKGVSTRITVPKIIRERLELKEEDIVGFYEEDGKVFLKKIA